MQKKGKFILMDVAEFERWIAAATVSRRITLMQSHHTYIPGYKHFTGTNHFQLCEGMERSHRERGFAEIAQNLTIFPDGKVVVCRDLDKTPAGIKGVNSTGICIENLGNFDKGGDSMKAAQRDAIVRVCAALLKRFGLQANDQTLVYHHWYDLNTGTRTDGSGVTKTCPGTAFFGGNTVVIAKKNFVPLVAAALPTPTFTRTRGAALRARATRQGDCAEIVSENVKVRAAPSASSKLIKTLVKGTQVTSYARKRNWHRIDPTKQLWVFGRQLQLATSRQA